MAASGEFGLFGLDFLAPRYLERDVVKLLDRLGFRAELLDHLAVVRRLAEGLAVVVDDGKSLGVERLLEFLER